MLYRHFLGMVIRRNTIMFQKVGAHPFCLRAQDVRSFLCGLGLIEDPSTRQTHVSENVFSLRQTDLHSTPGTIQG